MVAGISGYSSKNAPGTRLVLRIGMSFPALTKQGGPSCSFLPNYTSVILRYTPPWPGLSLTMWRWISRNKTLFGVTRKLELTRVHISGAITVNCSFLSTKLFAGRRSFWHMK
jgi:hypothetical protein